MFDGQHDCQASVCSHLSPAQDDDASYLERLLLTLRSLVDQNQQWTQCVLQWLAQLALVAYLTQALIARTDLPMYATLATR